MRSGNDGVSKSPSGPSASSNGNSASPSHKAAISNVLNGSSSNGKRESNGTGHANGGDWNSRSQPQTTYHGLDREEVTRILIQAVNELGYDRAARSLSQESGYSLETSFASDFRNAVLRGDWATAEALVESGDLALSEDEEKDDMLFLLKRQKFLELLELRDLPGALSVLQQEMQPLSADERNLHSLTSFLMCSSADDLKFQAQWDGALGESRRTLLSHLSRYISPSVMIPEHRLAELFGQVRDSQIKTCEYHNTSKDPSLFVDHKCERDESLFEQYTELGQHKDEVWYVTFSNNGTMLATASKDGSVIIYDTASFEIIYQLHDHRDSVAYAAWSPDDTKIISCSRDKEARLWDITTGTCLRSYKVFNEPVTTAAWAPDGQTFVTGSLDLTHPLCIWSIDARPDQGPVHNFGPGGFRVHDCSIAAMTGPNAPGASIAEAASGFASTPPVRLVCFVTNNYIHIYDYLRREKLSQITLDHQLTCLNLSRDGTEMLTNLNCNEIWCLGVEDREVKQKYRGQQQGHFIIRSCFGGASEGFVVSGDEDGNISVWHRHSGRLLEQMPAHASGCVNAVAWNLTFPYMFASAGDDNKVRIYGRPRSERPYSAQPPRIPPLQTSDSDRSLERALPRWGSAGESSGSAGLGSLMSLGRR